MRSTRFEKSFERLIDEDNDLGKNSHLISSQNRFEILMNDHINEFACDFHIDFVAYLLCVLRIDSSRDDQNRIDFDLNKNRFEHLNKNYDSDAFSIQI